MHDFCFKIYAHVLCETKKNILSYNFPNIDNFMDSFTLTMLHNFVDLCMPDALRIIKLSMHGF